MWKSHVHKAKDDFRDKATFWINLNAIVVERHRSNTTKSKGLVPRKNMLEMIDSLKQLEEEINED